MHSWPLNNTCLNYMGLLIHGFLNKYNTINVFSLIIFNNFLFSSLFYFKNIVWEEPRWRNSMEGFFCFFCFLVFLFLHLESMKYNQINTKPSRIPRKLIWGLTQQSAQPEPQNSADIWHRDVNWGREKPWRAGRCFCLWREDRDEEATGNLPPPKNQHKRKWKSGNSCRDWTKKGQRRGFKFH